LPFSYGPARPSWGITLERARRANEECSTPDFLAWLEVLEDGPRQVVANL
jgi:hypothetical protein